MKTDLSEYVPPPGEAGSAPALPNWRTFAELDAAELPTPPAVVEGLLRRGELGILGGASKSFKSWCALDLALAVAAGSPWLGHPTTPGRVLIVNLELPEWCIRSRLRSIASSRQWAGDNDRLLVWTLRGCQITAEGLHARIKEQTPEDLALVIVDPVYRLLADRDENSARDVNDLLGHLLGITKDTGAALLAPAHFAKGNAAAKEAQDRVSGSGVFARFPDSLLTLTRHEEEGAYVMEAVLRTFPPMPPAVLKWSHPVFTHDESLDPSRLKPPPGGRQRKYDRDRIAALLEGKRLSLAEWWEAACGIYPEFPRKSFTGCRDDLVHARKVIKCATSDVYYLPASDVPATPVSCAD